MEPYEIKTPIWSKNAIGIGEYHWKETAKVRFTCTFRDKKHGQRLHPHTYEMTWAQAEKYPQMYVGKHPHRKIVRVIPFLDLKDFKISDEVAVIKKYEHPPEEPLGPSAYDGLPLDEAKKKYIDRTEDPDAGIK